MLLTGGSQWSGSYPNHREHGPACYGTGYPWQSVESNDEMSRAKGSIALLLCLSLLSLDSASNANSGMILSFASGLGDSLLAVKPITLSFLLLSSASSLLVSQFGGYQDEDWKVR